VPIGIGAGEPVDDRLGDDRPDPLDGRQAGEGSLAVVEERAQRFHRPELTGQRAGGDRSYVADAQRDQYPPELLHLRGVKFAEQGARRLGRLPLGKRLPALGRRLLGSPGVLELAAERRTPAHHAVGILTRQACLGIPDHNLYLRE